MSACACDYDPPSVYQKTSVKAARTPHKCYECSREIQPGEPYERVWAIWDGSPVRCNTCQLCLALREFVQAHVPCVCWAHGNIRDDAIEAAREWAHETVGLMFGAWRREVLIRRAYSAQLHQSTGGADHG